jgi:hypothetical protein
MHMSIHMHIAVLWREMATVARNDIAHNLGSRLANVNAKPPSRRVIEGMNEKGSWAGGSSGP